MSAAVKAWEKEHRRGAGELQRLEEACERGSVDALDTCAHRLSDVLARSAELVASSGSAEWRLELDVKVACVAHCCGCLCGSMASIV
jgi:hypothetical protein